MDIIEPLAQFGVAGLMGVLWVWERAHSRKRESQLSEAHGRMMEADRQLDALVELVRRNTAAMVALERSQSHMIHLMKEVRREMRDAEHRAA